MSRKIEATDGTHVRIKGTEAKIVKRILSWSPAGFTWKANPKHARDLIAWAGLEQSKAAGPSQGTAATTKTMRNAPDELPWERAEAVSSAGGTATYLAMDRPDIAKRIRRANQDIAKPKVPTEVRLKRVARNLLGEPELIWTCPYQEMPKKLVVSPDANWTGQDSENQKRFSFVVVRFGEHVIDVVCSQQDVVSLSAPESEFYTMTTGGSCHPQVTNRKEIEKRKKIRRPHVFSVEAQLSLCTDVDSQCRTSTDPDLSCLVVAATLSPSSNQESIRPSHSINLRHLHTGKGKVKVTVKVKVKSIGIGMGKGKGNGKR